MKKMINSIGFSLFSIFIAMIFLFVFVSINPCNIATPNATEMITQINNEKHQNSQYAPSLLGLDPKHDKIVYKTEQGIEIKFGGANFDNGSLKGYAYFTMGSYNGYLINWVIIGRHSEITTANILSELSFNNFLNNKSNYDFGKYLEKTTPAGQSIYEDSLKEYLLLQEALNFSNAVTNTSHLNSGEVFCMSECAIFLTKFHTSSKAPKYEGSNLQSVCKNLPTTLGMTNQEIGMVVPKNINSRYTSGSAVDIVSNNQSFYPPSIRNHVPSLQDMLPVGNLRVAYQIGTTTKSNYWLRDGSSSNALYIDTTGNYDSSENMIWAETSVTTSMNLRPCCVVKLI